MRHLQALNIDRSLDVHLTTYIRQQNAQVLRQHCLSIAPIQPVIQLIASQLKDAAEADKIEGTTQLQEKAYANQFNEDQEHSSRDEALARQLQRRKEEIQRSINACTTESRQTKLSISQLSTRLASFHQQLDDINRQLHLLQTQHSTTHHHQASASVYVTHSHPQTHTHGRPGVSDSPREQKLKCLIANKTDLLASIETLSREITQLKSTLHAQDTALRSLHTQYHEISGQEIQLRHREIARAERRRYLKGSLEALTQANRDKLDREIRANRANIDARRVNMEQTALHTCHAAFLNTLKRDLQDNILRQVQNHTNTALLNIIAQVHHHLEDLATLERSRTTLQQSQLNLNNQLAMRTGAESSTTRLDSENARLSDENTHLLETNTQLSLDFDHLLGARNRFAQYTFVTTAITAVATVAFYAFNSAFIPSVSLMLASVAGAAITGLLIATAIAWIRVLITQAEINDNCAKRDTNLVQIANNTKEMTQLSKEQLPTIEAAIRHYQQEVENGQSRVAQASANARQSLSNAEHIEVASGFSSILDQTGLGMFSTAPENRANREEHGVTNDVSGHPNRF